MQGLPRPKLGTGNSHFCHLLLGFSGGSGVKNLSTCDAGDTSLIRESRRSSGGGIGQSLQHSFLGDPMDRGAWRATVRGVAKSQTRLRDSTCIHARWPKNVTKISQILAS